MRPDISPRQVQINDPFWNRVQRLIREVVLPYQWEVLHDRVPEAPPSYCVLNFQIAAGEAEGTHQGVVFLDSDLYKWLEAASYSLMTAPDASLLKKAREAIDVIARAQAPDGYLNTYYTLKEPDQRFANLTEGHELYCAGHLIEAAVAFFEATSERKLLEVAIRFADCIARYFLSDDGKPRGCPGHPEIELSLVRLFHVTENDQYLKLCQYFLDARGVGPRWSDVERERGSFHRHWGDMFFDFPANYVQAHAPVRAQRKAAGHAVRAMYLYSAMADMARLSNDEALQNACVSLYENTVSKQMYVTGGIGSAATGERFTTDYDLPNDSAYAETCASVGLMMFSKRMWKLTGQARCFDTFEKALYNTVLGCMGKDGRHFFYVNPLSVDPRVNRENPTYSHVEINRAKWFGVACCPPNMARAILSLGGSIYAVLDSVLYVLCHIESSLAIDGVKASLSRDGDKYRLLVDAPAMDIKLRVPDGFLMESDQGGIQSGYVSFSHAGGALEYAYRLTPQIRVLRAHPHIAADAGKVCVVYGQIVYCLEEADNGKALCAIALPAGPTFSKKTMDWLPEGMVALEARGVRYGGDGWLSPYREERPAREPVTVTFVPYSQWNNRGEGEMCVWVNEDLESAALYAVENQN